MFEPYIGGCQMMIVMLWETLVTTEQKVTANQYQVWFDTTITDSYFMATS